jgi:hypothetical protein
VRQRFQEWRDRGAPKDEAVLVDADEQAIRAALHNENGWHFFESGLLVRMKKNRRVFLWAP